MSFSGKLFLPFRLKLLFAILAAAAAGIYLCYGGFRNALGPYAEEEAGVRLTARLDLAAAAAEAELASGLERARLTAARTGLRDLLTRQKSGQALPSDPHELQKRLQDAAAASPSLLAMDLLDTAGKTAASLDKSDIGRDFSGAEAFRRGLRGNYIGAPFVSGGGIGYEVAVPVPPPAGSPGGPPGVLRCRFRASARLQEALETLRSAGLITAFAKLNGEKLVIYGPGSALKELAAKANEASPFLAFLSGSEKLSAAAKTGRAGMIYSGRRIAGTDWIAAAGIPLSSGTGAAAGLSERVRLGALLALALLAASAIFAVSLLTAPLKEAGRQAEALMDVCGAPPGNRKELCEPAAMAAAMGIAAAIMKKHSYKDVELETETEKLREEEADLKSQNEELEKLNKYLMDREIKISELKKEISELREKVGGGVPE